MYIKARIGTVLFQICVCMYKKKKTAKYQKYQTIIKNG